MLSEHLKSSCKRAQSTPIDFLERKNGIVDLITPSELRDILDCQMSTSQKKSFYFANFDIAGQASFKERIHSPHTLGKILGRD